MKVSQVLKVLVLLDFLSETLAIYCLSCNSVKDPRCGEPLRIYPQAIVNCDFELYDFEPSLNSTFCRKITQTSKTKTVKALKILS